MLYRARFVSWALGFVAMLAVGLPAGADTFLNEPFNYPDGPLTTTSGGAWEKFDAASSGDAQVVNGAAQVLDTTDVVRFFPNVFANGNTSGRLSFDVNVNQGSPTEQYALLFDSGTSPATTGFNPNQGFGLYFDVFQEAAGLTNVYAVDFSRFPVDGSGIFNLGTISTGAVHNIAASLDYVAASNRVNYSVYIDGSSTPAVSDFFGLSDPRGLNAVDVFTALDPGASNTDPNAFLTLDNLTITPEPTSAMLFLLAGALPLFRRRQR